MQLPPSIILQRKRKEEEKKISCSILGNNSYERILSLSLSFHLSYTTSGDLARVSEHEEYDRVDGCFVGATRMIECAIRTISTNNNTSAVVFLKRGIVVCVCVRVRVVYIRNETVLIKYLDRGGKSRRDIEG